MNDPATPIPERSWPRRIAAWPFLGAIYVYRVTLGPLLGGQCRFHPTCSQYGLDAYRLHGPIRGTWLTVRRLLRCHPFGGRGYDPVPLPRDISHPKDAKTDPRARQMQEVSVD